MGRELLHGALAHAGRAAALGPTPQCHAAAWRPVADRRGGAQVPQHELHGKALARWQAAGGRWTLGSRVDGQGHRGVVRSKRIPVNKLPSYPDQEISLEIGCGGLRMAGFHWGSEHVFKVLYDFT